MAAARASPVTVSQSRTPDSAQLRLLQQARELQRQGRGAEAIARFREALDTDPANGEVWYELGYLLKSEGRYEESLQAFGHALTCVISRPEEVHLNRAVLFSDHFRRDDDAERELRAALALAPHYVPAMLNLGNLQEERGQRDQALQTYETLLAQPDGPDPDNNQLRMEALARIANMRPPASLNDPLLQRVRDAAESQPDKTVRANLLFALGNSYDRLGVYDLAFDAYAKANRWLVRQAGQRHDRGHVERLTDALIDAFPSGAKADAAGAADLGRPEPLFICGMFRSGSTLIEQVLAAHPQVSAGGELDWLRRLASVQLAPFPQTMATLDAERLRELAAGYQAHLRKLFPLAAADAFITDKRPDNFLLIGLIKRLFPSARIIHTTRDPLDNGLSIFAHHLHPKIAGYACDLSDIGHYFGQYRRLMAHWQALYPGDILDFDYDAFVADPRPALEALLGFLDLPWDDRCLDFHRLGNTVKTASYWQIRQPLHSRASGRWRNYGPHLDPLRRALAEAGLSAGNQHKVAG
nr:sulfotransferase [Lysobacter sp. M2-1]